MGSTIRFSSSCLFILAALAFSVAGYGDPTPYAMDPNFEGAYVINIECRDETASEECLQIKGETKMVISNLGLQSPNPLGVAVTIIHPRIEMPLYELSVARIQNGGATLYATTANSPGKLAEMSLDINPVDKKLLGYLRDAEFGSDLKITGYQIASPGALYLKVTQPLSQNVIQGKYRVESSNGHGGTLSVRLTMSGNPTFFATYTLDVGARINFDTGEFNAEMGVLSLVDTRSALKWVLAVEKSGETALAVRGLALSAYSGKSYTVTGKSLAASPQP